MNYLRLLVAVFALLPLAPARADRQSGIPPHWVAPVMDAKGWKHEPSGIVFPSILGGRKTSSQNISLSEPEGIFFIYRGTDGSKVSLLVFRGGFRGVGLWFERANATQEYMFGPDAAPSKISAVKLADKGQNVGFLSTTVMRGEGTKGYRSRAHAVVKTGDWLLLYIVTSPQTDAEALGRSVLTDLRALQLPPPSEPVGLLAPSPCVAAASGTEAHADLKTPGDDASAVGTQLVHEITAESAGAVPSLVTRPELYCREVNAFPSAAASLYRPIAGPLGDWTIIDGSIGLSIASRRLDPGKPDRYGIVLATTESSEFEFFSDGAPSPPEARDRLVQQY